MVQRRTVVVRGDDVNRAGQSSSSSSSPWSLEAILDSYRTSSDQQDLAPSPSVMVDRLRYESNGGGDGDGGRAGESVLAILLPLLVVCSTLLVLVLVFLIGVLFFKRKRGIR